MCHRPSVSLNKEKVSREIRENKIAVCEKTQGLRSGKFSDLNSACSEVLVPVKIFQFHHMHYESEQCRDAANSLLELKCGFFENSHMASKRVYSIHLFQTTICLKQVVILRLN